jgi:HYR domain
VDIRLSTDGGASFPTLLAAGTANDGTESVAVPKTLASNARVRIDSVGNIFFALSPPTAIEDTLDPTIQCPPNVVVECTGNNGIAKSDPQLAAFFAGVSASDACDSSVSIANNAPAFLPVGPTNVTFTATDDSSNSADCVATITVADTQAPTIAASVSPDRLWPPNHKLVDIAASVVVADVCNPSPTFVLTSVTSNEPDNGTGDGDTVGDIQDATLNTPDVAFKLRAERSGNGSGRVYTVKYTASDGAQHHAGHGHRRGPAQQEEMNHLAEASLGSQPGLKAGALSSAVKSGPATPTRPASISSSARLKASVTWVILPCRSTRKSVGTVTRASASATG